MVVLPKLLAAMMEGEARLMVPPERVMNVPPEKVRLPEFTGPLTVSVPEGRAHAVLPKKRLSVVAVVMLPMAARPLLSVVQPWEGPGVGASQVPLAAAKPMVVPLLSQ
jgi:hypothetical protein